MSEFQINRNNYKQSRIIDNDLTKSDLDDGQVLVKIDKFALTANNITYAVVGDQLGYWQFFPPHISKEDGDINWGILPVWGFADVVQSRHNEVPVGERLFGYFPPASHLKMTPCKVDASLWIDGSEHRSGLPVTYNIYRKVEHEPGYNKAFEDYRMLLYPLHATSFALYDYIKSNDWFGATQIIMLSASSKTSIGLAYGINNDDDAPHLIGLTSPQNVQMLDSLSIYETTLSYSQLHDIDANQPSVIVDMSGNGELLSALHKHLGSNMKFCSNVGATHWQDMAKGPDFIAQRSELFFAPSQIQKRIKEWGMPVFEEKTRDYLNMSIGQSSKWLKLTEINGLQGMTDIFEDMCDGKVSPELGLTIKMQ